MFDRCFIRGIVRWCTGSKFVGVGQKKRVTRASRFEWMSRFHVTYVSLLVWGEPIGNHARIYNLGYSYEQPQHNT